MDKQEILTLKETAEILELSPETVVNLVSQDNLEGIKVGNQWRFNREDVIHWKENQQEHNVEKVATEKVVKRFYSFINKDHIKMNLQAQHRFDVIAKMAYFARQQKVCRKNRWLFDKLCKREELISTAVGNGIAFLHPRKIHESKIKKSAVLLGVCNDGIEFRSIDKEPVQLFFLVLMQSEKEHLFALSYLSQLFRNGNLKERILQADSKEEVIDLLTIKFE